jgi:O-antigen/teichoic acid export membrane protein
LVGNVVANIVLVPTLGISGAAAAYLVTETVLLVAFFAVLRRAPQAAVKPAT